MYAPYKLAILRHSKVYAFWQVGKGASGRDRWEALARADFSTKNI